MFQLANGNKRLVKKCIKGETKAQKELYDLFSAKMLSTCYRYARNKTDAEDIFQTSWLKVYENIHQLRNTDLLEWWMKKIFVNEAFLFYKKIKRIVFSDENYLFEQDNRADERIIQDIHYDQITKTIQDLPDKMRMVFNLYIIEGFSHKEIAETMEISVGTSKSQLHDARKIIKQKIELLNTVKKQKFSSL